MIEKSQDQGCSGERNPNKWHIYLNGEGFLTLQISFGYKKLSVNRISFDELSEFRIHL